MPSSWVIDTRRNRDNFTRMIKTPATALIRGLLAIIAVFCLVSTIVHAEHWIPAPPPPEMRNDSGDWWLDTDSIERRGNYTFFTYHRGAEKGTPPSLPNDMGHMAFNCSTGDTLVGSICSGSCPAAPVFPDGWLLGTHYSRQSFLYATVCGRRPGSEEPTTPK
ncbi:hypothetical protein ACVWZV_004471 [Bradyrhizobium sp. GM5.1]